jgi:uncharacterized repeat protein (TIGR02543 family)
MWHDASLKMRNAIVRHISAALLLLVSVLPVLTPAVAAADYPLSATDTEIEDAIAFLRDAQTSDGSVGGFVTSAWVVMALAVAGEDPNEFATSTSADTIIEYLMAEADTGSYEATDWARMILAIVAAGLDPTDFDGVNYVAGLQDTYEEEDITGEDYLQLGFPDMLNDDFWGVMALEAAGESADPDVIDFVLEMQNDDGGWSWDLAEDSDVDSTAAAIMALRAAGTSSSSTSIQGALDFLADAQNDDGGFPELVPGVSNAASTAWAIAAIRATGANPNGSAWDKDGDTPVDYLLSLQTSSGSFQWKAGEDDMPEWMTAYAIPALMSVPYPVPEVEVQEEEEEVPEISFSPSSIEFEATVDGDDPDDETLQIWNSGEGKLDWSVSDNANWLSLSPSSGSSQGEKDSVKVVVDISGLDEGTYTARITIEDEDSGDTERVDVELVIEEEEEEEEPEPTVQYYLLVAVATPAEGGSVTKGVAPGASGYEEGTSVVLTANPAPGYTFVGWAGEAGGSNPSITVTMTNHRSITARFFKFDTSALDGVSLAMVPPDLVELAVIPYPIESIPSDPPGFTILKAYVIQPVGSGTFTLQFDGLNDADNVALYQVVNGQWTQVPRSVLSPTTMQVTLPVAETVLTLAYPGSSGSNLLGGVGDFFNDLDGGTILALAIAAVLVILIVVVIVVLGRRGQYSRV